MLVIFLIMRIAFIGQKGIPATTGGVESHVERLALGLQERGHKVLVYARTWYNKRQIKTYRGIQIIYKKSWRTKNFDAITHVWRASWDVIHRDVDVIHYHGGGPALLAWIPRWFKPSAKVIITFHSVDREHQKWGWFARQMLHLGEWFAVMFAHETITVSKTLQSYARSQYQAETIYVPNGIDPPQNTRASLIKKRFGLNGNDYILFLSRLVAHKGPQHLIEAYKQIDTKKKLVIAGGGAFTDSFVAELHALAKDNPNIIFTGSIQKGSALWRELYSNAYVFVLPSESEGLPIALLEAMSFSRCVLASNIPQNVEAVAGGYGFTYKNKDFDQLRNKLRWLIENPRVVRKVGAVAATHVMRKYDWEDIINAIEMIYSCVIDVRGKREIKSCLRKASLQVR